MALYSLIVLLTSITFTFHVDRHIQFSYVLLIKQMRIYDIDQKFT